MRRAWLGVALAFVFLAAGSASAQDFQKSYEIGAGGRVQISNISGEIVVTGYEGSAILVTATKVGRDRDRVEVEDLSSGNHVQVKVRYPERCNNCEASVDFQVKVPRSMNYDFDGINSVSGSLTISGISGRLKAASVSGEVKIKDVSGTVNASSVSGEVEVEITKLSGDDDMKFSSVSGAVDVRIPANLDATVNMSTLSGDLKTDFPLEVKKREKYSPGMSATGRLGDGSRRLHLSSVSGSVSLTRI
jgi:hypothetical protein